MYSVRCFYPNLTKLECVNKFYWNSPISNFMQIHSAGGLRRNICKFRCECVRTENNTYDFQLIATSYTERRHISWNRRLLNLPICTQRRWQFPFMVLHPYEFTPIRYWRNHSKARVTSSNFSSELSLQREHVRSEERPQREQTKNYVCKWSKNTRIQRRYSIASATEIPDISYKWIWVSIETGSADSGCAAGGGGGGDIFIKFE
jgi:hypothetical protein